MPALIATVGRPLSLSEPKSQSAEHWNRLVALYREHGALIFRFLRRRGVPERELDDALQETFLVAWRKLDTLRPEASVRGWLMSIAYRVASHTHRKDRKMQAHAADPEILTAPDESPEDMAARTEAAAVVARFVDELDEVLRDVFLLSEVDGLTAPEIVQATGTKLNTVYTRIRTSRRLFHEFLSEIQQSSP